MSFAEKEGSGMDYYAYPYGRWIKTGFVIVIAAIILLSAISSYNSLVKAEQDVESTWSQVENVMQRRADTLENLVKTVKAYTKHEEKVFSEIASARSVLISGQADINSKLEAGRKIEDSFRQVLAIVENYPELKSSEQYLKLQDQIEGSENRVTVARMDFINAVKRYNTMVKKFPNNIFARFMGFESKNYFKAEPDAAKLPDLNFD